MRYSVEMILLLIAVTAWALTAYFLTKYAVVPVLCGMLSFFSPAGSKKIKKMNRIYGPPPLIMIVLLLPTMPVFWVIGYIFEAVFHIDLPVI